MPLSADCHVSVVSIFFDEWFALIHKDFIKPGVRMTFFKLHLLSRIIILIDALVSNLNVIGTRLIILLL